MEDWIYSPFPSIHYSINHLFLEITLNVEFLIKHLKNNEINFIRWDNCINNAINGSIFAYSWYLNILCEDWEALVLGDYQYVMPLLRKSKFRKDIYFTSILGIRLGVFSNQLLSEEIIKKFIAAIPKDTSVIDICLNAYNQIMDKNISNISTFELDLIQSHKKITEKYTNQFQKDIATARKNSISVVKGLLPNDLINFSIKQKVRSKPKLNHFEIQKLRMIIAYSLRYNLGETYCAYGQHNNLQAVAFFIKSKRKLHLLYAGISNIGINSKAFHLLIDKYIEEHSEKDLTLNIENIISNNNQDFFTGVGAREYKFQRFYINNLSWIIKLLIKN